MFRLDAYVVLTSSPIPKYYSIRNDDLKLQEWYNSASHCWVHSTFVAISSAPMSTLFGYFGHSYSNNILPFPGYF